MSFIQAGFLMACAAVAIPVIVHLLNRWQVRRIELGTMRFLGEIIRDGAQKRKIRRWLLLATRMALITLLALLFARPFLPQRTRRDGDRLRVVLIDRSASMGMPGKSGRLVDDAVSAAADSVLELGEDAKILWAWFDRQVEPMPESTRRPSAPRAVVGDTNYLAALAWARDRIDAFPDAIADVVMVTDLQQAGLASEQLDDNTLGFPSDVPVRIVDVGRPAANNLAITSVSPSATRLELGEPVTISATLFNFGTLPFEEVPLSALMTNGKRTIRLKKSLNVPGGQAEEVTLDFGELESGVWQATVTLDVDDDLASDNRRLTALEVTQPIDVLVLDSGSADDGYGAESYYVTAALLQSDNDIASVDLDDDDDGDKERRCRFGADVIYLQDDATIALDHTRYPLAIVADAASQSATLVQQLEVYVSAGGRLLAFAGDGVDGNSINASVGSGVTSALEWWSQTGLAPGEFELPQRSGVTPFRIVSLGVNTAMLAPFADPQHGDLSRLAFHKLLPVTVPDSTRVLAWFDHEHPAVTEHSLGAGRVVWFMSSADASWGNWTTSPLYLPIIQQMVSDLLNLTGEGPIRFRHIGDTKQWIVSTKQPPKAVASLSPVAYRDDAPPVQSLIFDQSGFEQSSEALFVINGSSRESDPTRTDASVMAQQYGLTLADGAGEVTSTRVDGEKRHEYWPWLAAAVLVLLVAEFGLANRTSA